MILQTKTKQNLLTQYSAKELNSAITTELNQWQTENKVQRLWQSDATLWTNAGESSWTGWLNLPQDKQEIFRIHSLAQEIHALNATDIVVLGMGGSSLCPAMLADTFGKIGTYPRLHVLDSTDPDEIHHIQNNIDLKNTFFIVSSKSGTTLEPNIFKDYFYSQLQIALKTEEVGHRFIAITDPGTALEKLAIKENFKAIFYGIPSVGGRYSALSNFGMVPLGLMGIPVEEFLNNVNAMYEACSPISLVENNPGVVLGIVLGIAAKHGKDKVTLIASPGIHALGAWLEQLIAESTGKVGKGLIPIDQEPLGDPNVYGEDRVFAYIRLESEPDYKQDRAIDTLEEAGFIVIRLHVADKMHLGAELFRWEIAIAVAGSIIGINPFDQPDVEESKILALRFTTEYEKTQRFTESKPFFSAEGISLYTYDEILNTLKLEGAPTLENYFRSFLQLAQKNDYVNFSAFIAMFDQYAVLLQKSRLLIRNATLLATCLGFGPRFLHSTGQDYKGGPNTGLFFQITADHKNDLPVPGHHYTFGLVIDAQAQADFTVLAQRKRRILRVHFDEEVEKGLKTLFEIFSRIL
jgi:glucose-6-phosphate isomerase